VPRKTEKRTADGSKGGDVKNVHVVNYDDDGKQKTAAAGPVRRDAGRV